MPWEVATHPTSSCGVSATAGIQLCGRGFRSKGAALPDGLKCAGELKMFKHCEHVLWTSYCNGKIIELV